MADINLIRAHDLGLKGARAAAERLAVSLGLMMKAMRGSIENAIVHELDALFPQEAAAATAKKAPPSRKKGG